MSCMQYHKSWVIRKNGILMVLSDEAITTIRSYAQDEENKTEAGGILLGKRRRNHFEVIHVTEPTEYDIRSRYHWIRSDKIHSDIAKKYWVESQGQITYLGEWHTHPETTPSPSTIDLNEWRVLVDKCSHPAGMSMIIGGTNDLWCGIAQKESIIPMSKVT